MKSLSALTTMTVTVAGLALGMLACGDVDGLDGGPARSEERRDLDPPPGRVTGTPVQPSAVVVVIDGVEERDTRCRVAVRTVTEGLYGPTTRTTHEVRRSSTGRPVVEDTTIARARVADSGRGFRVQGLAPGTTVVHMHTACGVIAVPVTVVAPVRFTGGLCLDENGADESAEPDENCGEVLEAPPVLGRFEVTVWYGPVDEENRLIPGWPATEWNVRGALEYSVETPDWGPNHAVISGTMARRDVLISEPEGLVIRVPHIPRDQASIVLCHILPSCVEDERVLCIIPRAVEGDDRSRPEPGGGLAEYEGDDSARFSINMALWATEGCIRSDTPFPYPFYVFPYLDGVIDEETPWIENLGVVGTDGGGVMLEWHDGDHDMRVEPLQAGLVDIVVRWSGQDFAFPLRIE